MNQHIEEIKNEMQRLYNENASLRHENDLLRPKRSEEYQFGKQQIDNLDEKVTQLQKDIFMDLAKYMKSTAYLSICLRDIEENPSLTGGSETADKRTYITRRDALSHKIANLQKTFKMIQILVSES